MNADLVLLPYFLLLLAVVTCWRAPARYGLGSLILATLAGVLLNCLQPLAVIWILISGVSIWAGTQNSLGSWMRWPAMILFLLTGVAMSNHLLPGFNNLLVFDKIQFSPDSAPISMYLNFDKTVVGIFIYLFFLKKAERRHFQKSDFEVTIKTLGFLLAFMMPLAVVMHYVKLDPKFPPYAWLWILNNLFFVCVAEETLFRGLIQGGFSKFVPQPGFKWLPLIVSSLLFGLAHFKGGISYILLATIAGVFYAYAYDKTKRIESPILVHFGLNLVHFLFFSYPWLSVG